MSKQQLLTALIEQIPDEKLDTILSFIKFVIAESNAGVNNSVLSKNSLAKDWLLQEEEYAWSNL